MNDWDLSETNLRKVYDYCNRRGMQIDNSLDNKDISEVKAIYHSIAVLSHTQQWGIISSAFPKIKAINSRRIDYEKKERINQTINEAESILITSNDIRKKKKSVRAIKRVLVSIKDSCIDELFSDYCHHNNSTDRHWEIIKISSNKSSRKDVYTLSDGCDYLYCRIIQESIKHNYGIRVGNREHIITQLKCLLDDQLPKAITRTDIKSFFESIDTDRLIGDLENENKIQKTHINSIRAIVSEYHKISNQTRGIPRGIGISSYLAEKYLYTVDEKIRRSENVLFYSRFVDDIVIVTTEKDDSSTVNANSVYEMLKKEIDSIDLELHPLGGKTSINSFASLDFNYLGYHFLRDSNHLVVDIAQDKVEKLKSRLNLSFVSFFNREYCSKHGLSYKKKLRILRERIDLLSCQVHLLGMSKKIIIGTPITYSEVTRNKSFDDLNYEYNRLLNSITDTNVHKVLSGVSFNSLSGSKIKRISYRKYKYLTTIWK